MDIVGSGDAASSISTIAPVYSSIEKDVISFESDFATSTVVLYTLVEPSSAVTV
jgi:hypothetical protein